MNTDVEELLREGMERCTQDLRAPAGLTGRAVRRRRRRLALRSVTVAALAASAAGAVTAIVVLPGAGLTGAGRPVADTAYVVRRVATALSAADPGTFAQMTVTTSNGTKKLVTTQEWSYGDRWRAETYSQTGQPLYDENVSSSSVYTMVSYPGRTWARQTGLGYPAGLTPTVPGCPLKAAAVPLLFRFGLPAIGVAAGSLPGSVASTLRTAVSCGSLTVAGRQRVDGVEAIELMSSPDSPLARTIWVSPGTYLPLRAVTRLGNGPAAIRQTADFTWLQPTTQNLAKLAISVPAGFRRVSLLNATLPILRQVPYGLLLGGPSGLGGVGPRRLVLPTAPAPGYTP